MPRISTKQKQKIKRSSIRKLARKLKIMATGHFMMPPEGHKAREAYALHKEAVRGKELERHKKALRKKFAAKGMDYDKHIRKMNHEAAKRLEAEAKELPTPEKRIAGVLTSRQIKKGYTKKVCKCGASMIGRGSFEILMCGKCGLLKKSEKENYAVFGRGGGFTLRRKVA